MEGNLPVIDPGSYDPHADFALVPEKCPGEVPCHDLSAPEQLEDNAAII
jgi:hypothetical protein